MSMVAQVQDIGKQILDFLYGFAPAVRLCACGLSFSARQIVMPFKDDR